MAKEIWVHNGTSFVKLKDLFVKPVADSAHKRVLEVWVHNGTAFVQTYAYTPPLSSDVVTPPGTVFTSHTMLDEAPGLKALLQLIPSHDGKLLAANITYNSPPYSSPPPVYHVADWYYPNTDVTAAYYCKVSSIVFSRSEDPYGSTFTPVAFPSSDITMFLHDGATGADYDLSVAPNSQAPLSAASGTETHVRAFVRYNGELGVAFKMNYNLDIYRAADNVLVASWPFEHKLIVIQTSQYDQPQNPLVQDPY